MARIRSIKPELRTDLTVGSWPIPARYAWVLLLGYLDDKGRGRDDIRLIVADLFPLDRDVTERKMAGWINLMAASVCEDGEPPLCRYEVAGQRYLHARKWGDHQRINRPTPSQLPPCPVHEKDSEDSGTDSLPDSVKDSRNHSRSNSVSHSVSDSHPRAQARAPAEQGAGSREQGAGSSGTGPQSSTDRTARGRIDDDGLDQIASATHGNRDHASRVAADILTRANGDVRNPLGYVLKTIGETPERYRANSGRHPPGPRDPRCPTHPGEHRDRCRGCAADRLAARPSADAGVGASDEPPW